MKRLECLMAIGPMLTDEPVITNIGPTRAEWEFVRPSDANLYQAGLGNVLPVSLGIALCLEKSKVVALDGDGSILLFPGALATAASQAAPNLLLIVFDNEAYESTGGQATATGRGTDLEAVARGFGWSKTATARTVEEFAEAVRCALCEDGPHMVVAKVQIAGGRKDLPADWRPSSMDGKENKYRFARYMEAVWGRNVLRGPEYASGHSPHVKRKQ
ncbi:MAG: thiamine pyrophosphate-binding protein [Chloroflexi bacterium]|nr:thiamine pyrophosphate-binding protein [Chloroflexota bacterium]